MIKVNPLLLRHQVSPTLKGFRSVRRSPLPPGSEVWKQTGKLEVSLSSSFHCPFLLVVPPEGPCTPHTILTPCLRRYSSRHAVLTPKTHTHTSSSFFSPTWSFIFQNLRFDCSNLKKPLGDFRKRVSALGPFVGEQTLRPIQPSSLQSSVPERQVFDDTRPSFCQSILYPHGLFHPVLFYDP